MKFGIVTFPGSNCDDDTFRAVTEGLGADAVRLWHKDHDLQGADVVILPGGFAYGGFCGSEACETATRCPPSRLVSTTQTSSPSGTAAGVLATASPTSPAIRPASSPISSPLSKAPEKPFPQRWRQEVL